MNKHRGFEALAGVRPLRGKVIGQLEGETMSGTTICLINKGVAEATPKLQKSQTKNELPRQTPRG